jgi:formyltetrahydrofolate-dependent phosphoribosylglycinamide formyltransferase
MTFLQASPYKLAVFISGTGTNMQAIHRAILDGTLTNTELALVVSNKADAPGLAYACQHLIPTFTLDYKEFTSPADYDQVLLTELNALKIDYIALAGYLKIITPILTTAFEGRITNIHPSLLPAYGGKNMFGTKVHASVLANGEHYTGCTVHVVTDDIDSGPVLGQRTVPVLEEDTVERLALRVQAEEHELYPAVLDSFINQAQLVF